MVSDCRILSMRSSLFSHLQNKADAVQIYADPKLYRYSVVRTVLIRWKVVTVHEHWYCFTTNLFRKQKERMLQLGRNSVNEKVDAVRFYDGSKLALIECIRGLHLRNLMKLWDNSVESKQKCRNRKLNTIAQFINKVS